MSSWMVEHYLKKKQLAEMGGRVGVEQRRDTMPSLEPEIILVEDDRIQLTAELLGRTGLLRPADEKRARLAAMQTGPGIDQQGRPTWDGRPCCHLLVSSLSEAARDRREPLRMTCPTCSRTYEYRWAMKLPGVDR